MSEEQDELERRLDAMYGSIRPRAGFEADLWARLEARRPWYRRLGALRGPALILAPTLAVLLLVGGFVFLLTGPGFHGGAAGGGASTASSQSAAPAFGKLPAPPGTQVPLTGQAGASSKTASNYAGAVPALPASALVYRQQLTGETRFTIAASGTQPPASDPVVAAKDFLARNSALPSYPYQITLDGSDVVFSRQFQVGAGQARLVTADGRPYGVRVTVENGRATGASGPVDQPLAEAAYPLRSAGQALAQLPAPAGDQRSPALTSAEVVYVVVPAGGFVYYEPALLFTGGGGISTLQPAVAPQFLQQ